MGKSLAAHVAEAKSKGAYAAEALSFDLNGLAGGPLPALLAGTKCDDWSRADALAPTAAR